MCFILEIISNAVCNRFPGTSALQAKFCMACITLLFLFGFSICSNAGSRGCARDGFGIGNHINYFTSDFAEVRKNIHMGVFFKFFFFINFRNVRIIINIFCGILRLNRKSPPSRWSTCPSRTRDTARGTRTSNAPMTNQRYFVHYPYESYLVNTDKYFFCILHQNIHLYIEIYT